MVKTKKHVEQCKTVLAYIKGAFVGVMYELLIISNKVFALLVCYTCLHVNVLLQH